MYRKRARASGSFKRTRSSSRRRPTGSGSYRVARVRTKLPKQMFSAFRPYYFKRMCNLADINFNTVGVGGLYVFKMSDVPNVAEFSALFDSYSLSKVVVKFKAAVNQLNTGSNASTLFVPDFFVAADYDSQTNPTSANDVRQYPNVKYCKANQDITYVLRPRVLTQVFRSAVTTGYMVNNSGVWLDFDQNDIPHYGLVYYASSAVATNQFGYHVEATYYFKCRGVL